MVDLKLIILLLLVVVGLASGRAPIKDDEKSAKLDSSYIVVFNNDVDLLGSLITVVRKFPSFKIVPKLVQVYHKVLSGFAITDASDEALEWFAKQDYINFVEKSIEWTPSTCTVTSPADSADPRGGKKNWGLDRINEQTYTGAYSYSPSGDGTGADIYVVDKGIQSSHEQFGANQVQTLSFTKTPETGAASCSSTISSSHGTWVASVAGAKDLGTAKGADLMDVNVDCNNVVSTTNLVKGLDAIADHVSSTSKCVIVMSFATATNQSTLHSAIASLRTDTNCIIVASAGNYGSSASYYPAAYDGVISVGAITGSIKLPCFSNYGSTVDIYAPGKYIWVANRNSSSTTQVVKVTGTSYAAPFVAGVAAIHLGLGVSASSVPSTIITDATTSVSIGDLPTGSNNRILYIA